MNIHLTNQYKEFISFKSIFYFCSIPIRLDSYKGCGFGCLYCFSQTLNNRQDDFFNTAIPANPVLFSRRMKKTQINNQDIGVINSCLVNRIPIHFGSVSDPFQPIEKKLKISYELLKILADYAYPTVISTKSTLLLNKDYINLIKKIPISIQISFSSFDTEIAKRIEPNAPSPEERLNCLKKLADIGFYTVARIQPYFVNHTNEIDYFLEELSKSQVKHIILEHLRIPTNSTLQARSLLWKNIGEDYLALYKRLGLKKTRINYELISENKIKNAIRIKKICHSLGMTFGSGDNDLHHLSDSFCCCGIPCKQGFDNFYKGHLGYIAFKAFKKGELDISFIYRNWQPKGSIREFINSDCRLGVKKTVVDYLEDRVTSNKRSNSLDAFYGFEFDPANGYYINMMKRKEILEL